MRRQQSKFAVALVGIALGSTALTGAAAADSVATSYLPAMSTAGCTDGPVSYITEPPPALRVLQVDDAWRISRGAGVVVAIVDSGVNARDPRLESRMAGGVDLVGDGAGANGYADQEGHGTAIASIIAAQASSQSGLVGVAPDAKIYSVRVYASVKEEAKKAGYGLTLPRIAEGIRAASDAGAQIINVSLSDDRGSSALRSAVEYATARGSLVIASAGNSDDPLLVGTQAAENHERYPAGYPDALGVTATTMALAPVVTDASIHGPQVEIAAPGDAVTAISLTGSDCELGGGVPRTSFATGYVSAAAALVASAYPNETPAQWAYRLTASAQRVDPDHRDDVSGWGVLQPYEALALIPGPSTRGPDNPFTGQPAPPAAAEAEPVVVIPDLDQHAVDMQRALLVGIIAAGALCVTGVVTAFLTARRRRAIAKVPSRASNPSDEPASAGASSRGASRVA